MIEIYDPEVSLNFKYNPKSYSRGNKILNDTLHYDARKFSFSARIVNTWNSLPTSVM